MRQARQSCIRFRPTIEALEDRAVPAGNVLASVVNGSLIVQEDPLTTATDNAILIEGTGQLGQFQVSGLDGTSVNGVGDAAIVIDGVVYLNVEINLKGGNNVATLRKAVVGQDVIVTGGSGNNNFAVGLIDGDIDPVLIGRNLKVTNGQGEDTTNVLGVLIGGNVTINHGAGGGGLNFNNCSVGGSLTFQGNSGNDDVEMDGGQLGGAVNLYLGGGNQTATINAVAIGGDVLIQGGNNDDNISVTDSGITGMLRVQAGNGANTVQIDADEDDVILATGVNLSGGTGNDIFSISTSGTFRSMTIGTAGVQVTLGDNAGNSFVIETPGSGSDITIGGNVQVTGGTGQDVFRILANGDNVILAVGGSVTATLKGNGDTAALRALNNNAILTVGVNVDMNTGAGDDTLTLSAVNMDAILLVGGSVLTQLGDGLNSMDVEIDAPLGGRVNIHSQLQIQTGDNADAISLAGALVLGTTTISTAGGADSVAIDASAFIGPFSLNTGADADTIDIERNTTFATTATQFVSTVNVSTGGGNDTVVLGTFEFPTVYKTVVFGISAVFNGGGGSNNIIELLNVVPEVGDPIYVFTNWQLPN